MREEIGTILYLGGMDLKEEIGLLVVIRDVIGHIECKVGCLYFGYRKLFLK